MYNYQSGDYMQQERLMRKRELLRISNSAGLSCILFLAISILVSYLALFASKMLPGQYSEQAVRDFYLNLDYIAGTLIPLPLSFFIFAKLNNMKISESLPLEFRNKKKILLTISVSFGIIIVLRLVISMITIIIEALGGNTEIPELTRSEGLGGAVVMSVVVTLMTGLIEEFAFRGLLLTALRKYGDTFAVIASSALFGLMHRNLISSINAFLLGIVMAYAVIITNSMWTSVIIHTLNNLQAIAILIFPYETALVFVMIMTLLMAVIGITAIVIAFVYRDKAKEEIRLKKEPVLSLPNRICSFFFAPVIVLLVVLIVFFDPIQEFLSQIILSVGL